MTTSNHGDPRLASAMTGPHVEPAHRPASRVATIAEWWPFLLFGYFTAHGLLLFTYKYLDDLAREHPGTFLVRLLEEMTGAYTAALLVPLIGAGAARADDGTDGQPADEEYEIPEGIGSQPWW